MDEKENSITFLENILDLPGKNETMEKNIEKIDDSDKSFYIKHLEEENRVLKDKLERKSTEFENLKDEFNALEKLHEELKNEKTRN